MSVRAITFDFWGTLFQDTASEKRQRVRVESLARVAGVPVEPAEKALQTSYREFFRCHVEEQRTMTPQDAVHLACEILGISLSAEAEEEITHIFATAVLTYPPSPVDGALEAVRAAAALVPTGLISDTGISPGDSLRTLLDRYGFSEHLRVMTFSDEVGVAKPQLPMFLQTVEALGVSPTELLHIGDLEATDIAGVQAVGGVAALFGGVNTRFVGNTAAQYTFTAWRQFIDALPGLCGRDTTV